jgi:hypothetical protein
MWPWILTGPETKSFCDDEGQQQFDRPTRLGVGHKGDHLAQKIIVAKSKEVKTGCNLAESSKKGYMAQKGLFCR